MTVTYRGLVDAGYAPNAQTTAYTAPPGVRTIVDKFSVTNNSGSGVTYALNLVPTGGSAGASNLIYSATIAANSSVDIAPAIAHALNSGDFLSEIAGTASALVRRVSGREVTAA